jgi:hypothetical protein
MSVGEEVKAGARPFIWRKVRGQAGAAFRSCRAPGGGSTAVWCGGWERDLPELLSFFTFPRHHPRDRHLCHFCRSSFVTRAWDVLAFKNNMRRIIASLVLGVMAWSLVAPAAMGAGTAAAACCRRNGKHHCASGMSGMAGVSTDDLPSFRANSPDCPYRSQIATLTAIAQPQNPAVITLRPPSTTFVAVAVCLFFESRLTTCNSQRGPPALWL